MLLRSKMFRHMAALLVGLACVESHSLSTLHPYFKAREIMPKEMSGIAGIGGIDLLPNGDGAVCTWGGTQKSDGEVWIIPGLASGTPGAAVRIATGLREPLGVRAVGNDFYVVEKPRILKFTGSGVTWTKSVFWSLPTAWYNDKQFHHFSFNLLVRDNALWFTTGSAWELDPKDPVERGALIKVPLDGGAFSQHARGLRNTDGLGLGPNNEFFANDNQGNWRPIDALYHVPTANVPAKGRFFGYRTELNNTCGLTPAPISGTNCPSDPEFPPAIWIPYGEFSLSPTRPILLKEGPYKGQMISGDVSLGGILRYSLERVNGEYQGAVYKFMDGLHGQGEGVRFGIHEMLYTPKGELLAAGIGGGDHLGGPPGWAYWGAKNGLDILTPTAQVPFDIQSIRSQNDGFDIVFTKPAGEAAKLPANYSVKTTVFSPLLGYGEDSSTSDNKVTVNVTTVALSQDGMRASIKLASMHTRRMYAINLSNIMSATGEDLYNNAGYYTLNNAGVASEAPAPIGPAADFAKGIRTTSQQGRISVALDFHEAYRVSLYRLDGSVVAMASGSSPATLDSGVLPKGLYLIHGSIGSAIVREKIRVD